jgi:hypothetical protein
LVTGLFRWVLPSEGMACFSTALPRPQLGRATTLAVLALQTTDPREGEKRCFC